MEKTDLPETTSDESGDHARGTKRKGGALVAGAPKKQTIAFVKSGEGTSEDDTEDVLGALKELAQGSGAGPSHMDGAVAGSSTSHATNNPVANEQEEQQPEHGDQDMYAFDIEFEPETVDDYMEELSLVRCVSIRYVADYMFNNKFGRLVLLARLWQPKLSNIMYSCSLCNVQFVLRYDEMSGVTYLKIGRKLVATSHGTSKKEGRKVVENLAWNILTHETITLLVKEKYMSEDNTRINPEGLENEQQGPRDDEFGAPVEASVAARMMQMMGWQGGGLGPDGQGISDPVRPNLQMINRAGLGSDTANVQQIRNAADTIMMRYIKSDCIDLDLIFSNDFSKGERAAIHAAAGKNGLVSRSYGQGEERFLVVKKKIEIYNLVRAVALKGGETPKYKLYVPIIVTSFNRGRR